MKMRCWVVFTMIDEIILITIIKCTNSKWIIIDEALITQSFEDWM